MIRIHREEFGGTGTHGLEQALRVSSERLSQIFTGDIYKESLS